MKIYEDYSPRRRLIIRNGDCMDLLRELPDECVDLTITSPPYCMGKAYESSTSVDDFKESHQNILPEVFRVTKPGGSICWQVGYHVRSGKVTPLDFLVHEVASGIEGLTLRNRIVWTFGHGFHASTRFSGRHEVILWYSKGDTYTFNLDAIRVPQKYPGKTHYKGDKKGQPSGNPLGKNPGNVWDIPSVKANHAEKTEHPCQFPIALAERLVKALTDKNQLVLDPFVGSGSTACAALLNQRRFVGSEIDPAHYRLANRRCQAAAAGTLKYRPHDRPVEVPSPRSKVARSPFAEGG